MKISTLLLLAVSCLTFNLFYSCGSDGFQSEPAQDALVKLNSVHSDSLYFNLDKINGKPINPGENVIEGEYLELEGWAIDPDAHQLAGKVYVSVGGKVFTTQYDFARTDVSGHFNSPALEKCGFFAKIPRSALPAGAYPVEVKVVAADKTSCFSSPEKAVLIRL